MTVSSLGSTTPLLDAPDLVGLEQIGQGKRALRAGPQRSGAPAGEQAELAAHVRLIGVACLEREPGQAALRLLVAGRQRQRVLHTEHPLKRLRAVADGHREPPVQSARADLE